MIEEELNRLKDKFYNSDLPLDDMVHFWFSLKLLADDFEISLEDLIKKKKEELSND